MIRRTLWIRLSFCVFIGTSVGCSKPSAPSKQPANVAFVALQDGFHGNQVSVKYDEKLIFVGKPRSNAAGHAEDFQFDRGQSPVGLLVLEFGGNTHEVRIDWSKGHMIGISFHDGKLHLRQQSRGFAYD